MCTVGRGNDAAVAIGLLNEMIVLLHPAAAATEEFGVPLHRGEIGGREEGKHDFE